MEENMLNEDGYLDLRGVLGGDYNNISRLEKLIGVLESGGELKLSDGNNATVNKEGSHTLDTLNTLKSLRNFLESNPNLDGHAWQNVPNLSRNDGETKAAFALRKKNIKASRRVASLPVDTEEYGTKVLGDFTKGSILVDTAGKSDAQEFGVCIYAACLLAGLDLDKVNPVEALNIPEVQKHLSYKESKIKESTLKQLASLSRQDNWKHTWIQSAKKLHSTFPDLTLFHFRSPLSALIYNTYSKLPAEQFTPLDLVSKPEGNKWNPADIWLSVPDQEKLIQELQNVRTLVDLNNFIASTSYASSDPKNISLVGVSLKGFGLDISEARLDVSRNVAEAKSIDIELPELFKSLGFKVKYNLTLGKRGEWRDEDPVISFRTSGTWNIVGQLTGKYAEGGKIANLKQYIVNYPDPSDYKDLFEKFIVDIGASYDEVSNRVSYEDEDLQDVEGEMQVNFTPDPEIQKYLKLEGISLDNFIARLRENQNRDNLVRYLAVRYSTLQILRDYGDKPNVFAKILRYCQSQIENVSSDFVKIH